MSKKLKQVLRCLTTPGKTPSEINVYTAGTLIHMRLSPIPFYFLQKRWETKWQALPTVGKISLWILQNFKRSFYNTSLVVFLSQFFRMWICKTKHRQCRNLLVFPMHLLQFWPPSASHENYLQTQWPHKAVTTRSERMLQMYNFWDSFIVP